MLAHPLQHVDQVRVGIDPVQPAGDDQTLQDPHLFRAEFGPAEQPVLSPHWDRPQRALKMVRVDQDRKKGPGSIFGKVGPGEPAKVEQQTTASKV